MNKWEVSRRTLLKDLGVGAACLPLLRAGQAKGAGANLFSLWFLATEGYRHPQWVPPVGPLTSPLPKSSVPLEAVKQDITYLTLMKNPGFAGCTACGHGAYGTIFYAQAPKGGTGEYAEPNGPTADQIIAQAIAGNTARPSFHAAVELQLPPSLGGPGHNHAFWAGAGQPMNYELDPVMNYAEIFGGAMAATPGMPMDDAATKALLVRRKSILDYVGTSLTKFGARLGSDDKMVVQGHLDSIRQLELQLSSVGSGAAASGDCGGNPGSATIANTTSANYEKIYDAYVGIMVAMIKCGVTRVATLQLGDATGDSINFGAFVAGVPASGTGYKTPYRNWHDLGHNPVLNGVDHKQIVDQWWMAKLATLITTLKGIPSVGGTGTLLDDGVIVWGNHMHEGADHGSQQIPWILAGSCGGYFKTGQSLSGNTTANALADICNAMGVTKHPFGAGFPGLKA